MIFTSEKALVKNILSKDYMCVNMDDTIDNVIDSMLLNNLPEAFVVDKQGMIEGMVTLSDIAKLKRAKVSLDLNIEEVMIKNVIFVSENYTVIECRNLLRKHSIKRLPVIEKNRIIGVIRYKEIEQYYYDGVEKAFVSYDLLLNNMHEAVNVIDADGTIILWNKAAELLYDIPETEIVGKKLSEFFETQMFQEITKTRKSIENFYHSPRPGCRIVTNAHPIVINEDLLGIINTDRDITEIEQLSKELDRVKHKLNILKKSESEEDAFQPIRGQSESLVEAINIAKQVAKTQATIMITGESGTGKEVFARAIFNESYTNENNIFVPVNCSAIPSELFESEFFGYEPGAFTGATKKGKVGLFELANNGTIFLDEIGDLPLFMQAKLLRVLQENKLKRVGGTREIPISTRIISATNKNLLKMVERGEFREDLYYRLNVIQLELPPLRERPEDIKILAMKFVQDLSSRNHKQVKFISDEVIELLKTYRWKGNIRELKNTIEYMVVLCNGDTITEEQVPTYMYQREPIASQGIAVEVMIEEGIEEKSKIIEALKLCGGNRSKAAKYLNMPRSTFYYKLKTYQIEEV